MAIRIFPSSITTSAGRTLSEKNAASILGYALEHRAVLWGFAYSSHNATTLSITPGKMIFDGYQIEVPDTTTASYYDTIYATSVSAPVVGDLYHLVCFLTFQDNNNEFLQTVQDSEAEGEAIFRIIPANFYTAYLENKLDYTNGGFIYRAQSICSFTYATSMTSETFIDGRNFLKYDINTLSLGWFDKLDFVTGDASFSTEFTENDASSPEQYYDMVSMLTKMGAGRQDLLSFLYDYIDFIQTGIRGLPSLKRGSKTFSQQYGSYVAFDSNQSRDDCLPLTTSTYGDTASPSVYNRLRYAIISGETTVRAYDFINTHIKYSADTGAVLGDIVTLDSTNTINAQYLPKASAAAFGLVKITAEAKEGTADTGIFSIAAGVLSCNAPRYAYKTLALNTFNYSGVQVGGTTSIPALNNNSILTFNLGSGLKSTPNAGTMTVALNVNPVLNVDTLLVHNAGVLDTTGNKGVAIRFNDPSSNSSILNPSFMFVKNTTGTDSFIPALSMVRESSSDIIQVGNINTLLNIKAINAFNIFCSNTNTPSTTVKMTLTSTLTNLFTDTAIGTEGENHNLIVYGDIAATGRVHDAVWNDYAEFFEKYDPELKVNAGDVIALVDGKYGLATQENARLCVGVCSDTFGHILGGETGLTIEQNMEKYIPVGIAGRVRVKVYGTVMPGDLLTISPYEGIAMSSCVSRGKIIGKALERKDDLGIGMIKMLIALG